MAKATLADLSADDQVALEKTKLAIRRRNSGDRTVHPEGQPHEFYAVVHDGRLLGVHEHDLGSGLEPHRTLRQKGAGAFPDLYDEDGFPTARPELVRIELPSEG